MKILTVLGKKVRLAVLAKRRERFEQKLLMVRAEMALLEELLEEREEVET